MQWTSCLFVHLSHQSIAVLSDSEVQDRKGKTKRKEKNVLNCTVCKLPSCFQSLADGRPDSQPAWLSEDSSSPHLWPTVPFTSQPPIFLVLHLAEIFSNPIPCPLAEVLLCMSLGSHIKGPQTSPLGYRQHGSWLAVKGGQSYFLSTVLSAPPEHQKGFSLCQRNLPNSATEAVSLRVSPWKALLLNSKVGVCLTLSPCPRVEGRTHSNTFSI